MLEEPGHSAYIRPRLPLARAIVGDTALGRRGTAGAVRGQAGYRHLDPHSAKTLLHAPPDGMFHLGKRIPRGMDVGIDGVAALAAKQLIHRQPRAFTKDVPQGHIDAAHRVTEHRPVSPIRADEGRLPDVLD